MRRHLPRRFRLYNHPNAPRDDLDPLLKARISDAVRKLCKKYQTKRRMLHACPVCESPVKEQVMYARGWAGAKQYICLKNCGSKRKKKAKAHITRPPQDGPSDEQLLEIEAQRELDYAKTLDAEDRARFEQVIADEAFALELAEAGDHADDVGNLPFGDAGNVLHGHLADDLVEPLDVDAESDSESESDSDASADDDVNGQDALSDMDFDVDPNSENHWSEQDLRVVTEALAASNAEPDVPRRPNESDKDYDRRNVMKLWPDEADELSHRQNVYRLFLEEKLGHKYVAGDAPAHAQNTVNRRTPVVALFLWTENGSTPTVLRVSTRAAGQLYLEDLSFLSATARAGRRDFEYWDLACDRWEPVRDGHIAVDTTVRCVVLRKKSAVRCMDLGKVLTAIGTITMPDFCRDEYELRMFSSERAIARRVRSHDTLWIVTWLEGGLNNCMPTFLPPNRILHFARMFDLQALAADAEFEIWDAASCAWTTVTKAQCLKVGEGMHTLLIRHPGVFCLDEFGAELEGLGLQ